MLAPMLDVAILEEDADKAMDVLAQLLDSVDTLTDFVRSPLYIHMQFRETDAGPEEVRRTLKQSFHSNQQLAFLKDHSRWNEVVE